LRHLGEEVADDGVFPGIGAAWQLGLSGNQCATLAAEVGNILAPGLRQSRMLRASGASGMAIRICRDPRVRTST